MVQASRLHWAVETAAPQTQKLILDSSLIRSPTPRQDGERERDDRQRRDDEVRSADGCSHDLLLLQAAVPKLLRDAQDVVHNVDRAVGGAAFPVVRADNRPAVVGRVVAGGVRRRGQRLNQRIGL